MLSIKLVFVLLFSMSVYFYGRNSSYYEFSNFYRSPIKVLDDDRIWPTVEHYYQAMKFPHLPDYQVTIHQAKSPTEAAKLGRDRNVTIRSDWCRVRDYIMVNALRAKFHSNLELKMLLISTESKTIIEKTTTDYYWGCGKNGTGLNKLGIFLMQIREEIK